LVSTIIYDVSLFGVEYPLLQLCFLGRLSSLSNIRTARQGYLLLLYQSARGERISIAHQNVKESQIFRFQRLWIGNLPAGAQQLGELQVQLAQIDQQRAAFESGALPLAER